MDQKRGQRKFLYDLVYKWTPLGLIVYLFIVCTALLSVSGKLSHAEVVGFCVTAGLLIAFFAICHLVLYCTRIKDQVDLEKAQGNSSTSSSNPRPGGIAPVVHNPLPSVGVHGQQAQQNHYKNGQQVNQIPPSYPRARGPHTHPAGPRPHINLQARVEDATDNEPVRPPLRVANGVHRSTLSVNHLQPHRQRVRSHDSAAPEPLSTRAQRAGNSQSVVGGPREYKPYRRPDPKTPSHHPRLRDPRDAVEEVSSLHTAGLTPDEAMDSVHRTMGREPWSDPQGRPPSQQRRHDQLSVGQPQGSSYAVMDDPSGHRVERQLFLGSPSFPNNLVRPPTRLNEVASQVGPQNLPVELSGESVQGYLLLIQEPDLMDLLSRRLLEWKARPCHIDRPEHDDLEKSAARQEDTGVVVLDNAERKSVNIHEAPATVERMRSQRAQWVLLVRQVTSLELNFLCGKSEIGCIFDLFGGFALLDVPEETVILAF
ncbi:hypothetical protein VMCG_04563 [Cytospora schulzeri]|uniref:Uncharacterized protein n=1 Tax=Cytospora schulzeri TaxID=448051 RepID=A0A423WRH9_9PEZI|nr:hypothetical protein VMCG_04563 [Valsa malicola]